MVRSKAAATKRATALAEAVTLPAGTTNLTRPPSAALAGDGSAEFTGPYLVQVARWRSVPGRLAAVTAAILAHPPTGFDGCTGVCPETNGTITDLTLYPDGDTTGTTSIGVTLQQAAGHVDVRIVGDSIWEPERSSHEHVPATVRTVHLSLGPHATIGPRTVVTAKSATISGAGAAQLAALLNKLPTAVVQPAPAGCYDGGIGATARFRLGRNILVFSGTNGHCEWIYPTYNGVAQPTLVGNPLPLVEKLLGGH